MKTSSGERLSERKERILKAVVDEYIKSAAPVSSGEIQTKHFNNISSATIRSELSTLEDMGYLIQPHTSAGRIPSKKAYKLYVEKFLVKTPLKKGEIDIIHKSFDERFAGVEEVVKRTAKVISDVTNYTSVIVINSVNKVRIKEIKLVALDEHTALVIIITDSGIIRDKIITLSSSINDGYVSDASALLNKMFSGKTVSQVKNPTAMMEKELADFRELFENILRIFSSYREDDVIFEGASKMLDYPGHDIETAKNFLSVIETKEQFAEFIDDGQDIEFSVKIGADESGGLDKCAIVTAKYKINGQDIGHAGVIGPERMDYSKVVSVLKYVGKTLDIISKNKSIDNKENNSSEDNNGEE